MIPLEIKIIFIFIGIYEINSTIKQLKDACNCNIYLLSLKIQPVHISFQRKQGRNVISNQKNLKNPSLRSQ
jgi:hypothetical protein